MATAPDPIEALRETATDFHRRGWMLGTAGNLSVVTARDPLELRVSASGKDKGRLERGDFVRVDARGRSLDPGTHASAETLLHVVAAEAGAGAVLHTHSVHATLLSDRYFAKGGFAIEDYEMLKGLDGIDTHESRVWIEIFDNSQDIGALAERVRKRLRDRDHPLRYGYLIRRHGMYTWGRDLPEARRHVEILEFLLECVARGLALGQTFE